MWSYIFVLNVPWLISDYVFQDPLFETHSQNRPGPEGARRTSLGSSSSMRKASSTTNVVDAFNSSFGGSLLVGNLSLSLSHTHVHVPQGALLVKEAEDMVKLYLIYYLILAYIYINNVFRTRSVIKPKRLLVLVELAIKPVM